MKKVISFICFTAIFLATLTAFAGDVPEGLLSNDEAQVFFGEILSYSEGAENSHISVSPVKKIKGDVLTGTKQHYDDATPIGDIDVKPGNVYLITYFDENNPTYIFEVTSYDTSTLKLKNTTGDMWERFEEYLNEGEYEKAEQDRINKLNAQLTEVGDEITLSALLETEMENCTQVDFLVNSHFGGFEIDKTKFYEIANEIRLVDIENTLVTDADAGLAIRCYEGEEIHEVTIWDNCTVAGSRVAMYSAPTGDYIIKAEDFNKLLSLLPEDAQPKLPPLKSLYANFYYWFIYNSTTAYTIGAIILVILICGIVFVIRRKKR